jgi:signal transduction histidine kinase
VPATPSPSAEAARGQDGRRIPLPRRLLPRTFQARLTLAFVGVITLTVALISLVVVNRLDDAFQAQDRQSLTSRWLAVSAVVNSTIVSASGTGPVVTIDNLVTPAVEAALSSASFQANLASVAQADVTIRVGSVVHVGENDLVRVAPNGRFTAQITEQPRPGQTREDGAYPDPPQSITTPTNAGGFQYGFEVQLVDPYTFRASGIANVTGLLIVIGIIGIALSVVVAAFLASRFATPLRRLSEAAKKVGEGDLASRVSLSEASAGSSEIGEVSRQFNAMAGRLEDSIEIIRRDRDRSREFLADVSHELRTPIAAMRTFNELLQGPAGADPVTRAEFLESNASQLGRLDWLAQNLLDLSKLDSGLVFLDLRPDDLRASVESATEQVEPAAAKRSVTITLDLPDGPVRVLHDPQRIGQVVSNLVGNAVKFTPRGGRVRVSLRPTRDGAAIEVRDTGIGIPPDELPHIFDRFYRGAQSESRSSGSGLGLAIVKSIVDMHGGRVVVESLPGEGSRFRVLLPRDPQAVGAIGAPPLEDTTADEVPATDRQVGLDRPQAVLPTGPDPIGLRSDAADDDESSGPATAPSPIEG